METMTYAMARLIIWNPEAYDRASVTEASFFILSSLSATREDISQAATVAIRLRRASQTTPTTY